MDIMGMSAQVRLTIARTMLQEAEVAYGRADHENAEASAAYFIAVRVPMDEKAKAAITARYTAAGKAYEMAEESVETLRECVANLEAEVAVEAQYATFRII